MTITVDTSVLVEFLLDQKRADECGTLLDSISKKKIEAVVSHSSLHAIEAMVRSHQKLSLLLKNMEVSMQIFETTISDEQAVAILSGEIRRDFDDTLQYYVAKRTGSEAIVSFDRHFDKLDIPRLEPSEMLERI